MEEQRYVQNTANSTASRRVSAPDRETLFPAEGRSDVAGDLEEEQRDAYSSHRTGTTSQGKAALKSHQKKVGRDQKAPSAPGVGTLFPAEGRSDVAGDLEEEQRDAYSAHHTGVPS
jgi:hypothetical protein